jgi:hypothetical protein
LVKTKDVISWRKVAKWNHYLKNFVNQVTKDAEMMEISLDIVQSVNLLIKINVIFSMVIAMVIVEMVLTILIQYGLVQLNIMELNLDQLVNVLMEI